MPRVAYAEAIFGADHGDVFEGEFFEDEDVEGIP